MNIVTIRLAAVRIDGDTQSRTELNQAKIDEYRERMEQGDIFPPISVRHDGVHYWLSDGFHRYFAMTQLGMREAEADSHPGTKDDAQVDSLSANAKHGLPRTNADKRRSVEKALTWNHTKNLEDRQIADLCSVSAPFVASIRRPEAKERQKEARNRDIVKKAFEINQQAQEVQVKGEVNNPIIEEPVIGVSGAAPSAFEVEVAEKAHMAKVDLINRMMEEDDKLAVAMKEVDVLQRRVATLELHNAGLLNEKSEAIKQVKRLQKQLDKLNNKG
jgi:flagellar biosynthesis/type III secretory pathway chaperone